VTDAAIKTLILLSDGAPRELVEAAFAVDGEIRVMDTVEHVGPGWRLPPTGLVDVAVVASAGASEQGTGLIAAIAAQRPALPIVICHTGTGEPGGLMQKAFGAGADDLVSLPETPERLVATLRKAIARKRGPGSAEAALSPLIAVVGPKGGTGKTVTTINLMAALADTGRRTVAVDLDLTFGDLGLGLQLLPERTIYELARMGSSLDAEKIEGFLATHERSGARALLAPIRPDRAAAVLGSDFLTRLFSIMRADYDFVVVDTPAGFTPEVITAIDNSTDVCMVGMLDAFSLKDTKLGLETLELMGHDPSRIHVVLNRADKSVGISHSDVTAILGRAPDVLVPSSREVVRSVNEGIPVVLRDPRSGPAKAFRELAALYLRESRATVRLAREPRKHNRDDKPQRRRLFRRR